MALSVPAIMKTTAARLSALYLLLFAICAVLLVFYMTSLSARMLTAQTQETINDEVLGLARAYQRGGLPILVRVVEQRSRQPGANLYLIADANGQILTGNVQSLEPGVLEAEGWTSSPFSYQRFGEGELERQRNMPTDQTAPQPDQNEVQAAPGEKGHNAIALVLRLPNQMIMLVGRDLGEPERFRAVIRRALMLALGMMGLGGLLIWFFVGRAALKRIDSVSEASRRIMGGDLSGRLPVTGAGDEFDRLSENLNSMLARIATLNEGLKQVSDNIAHDLKTPLTRLRNRAEATLSGTRKATDYRQALEATIVESDQLIKTFNAILMISRLEAGYSSENTIRVDLAAAVRDVVELYEPVAEEAGVSLEAATSGAFIVVGNRELIGQALSNIVDNAIKYSTDSTSRPAVRVTLERAGGEIRLCVADNGQGIPDDADRARVTERFVRLEKSRSQPGSGLGLSLAKAVMTFHKGRLDLLPGNPGLSVVMSFPARGGSLMSIAVGRADAHWLLKPTASLAPLDQSRARHELAEIAAAAREEDLPRLADFLAGRGAAQDFLAAVFDLSPFLRDLVRRRPRILDGLFDMTIEARLKAIGAEIDQVHLTEAISGSGLMMELRQWKAEAHLLIALADLAGEAETVLTVRRLSDLADACTRAAVDFLLLDAHGHGKLKLPDLDNPSRQSGWILLGMGKLGAHELNFSSDIDLVVFFDPEAPAILDPLDATELFSRLTRRLVRILQDRTENGYVFRTDLRLRPDPGSTPLAIPVEAALRYYEARGQNWERAAMIKARPVAGDMAAGAAFLKELQPYIWRKYMDYAAIADVHSIKRQIHAHKGHGDIAVKGHNVKLGRGGIREIEFFVQTQQLIAGGRFPELRGRETVPMLGELAVRGWITAEARDALARQYWFLRRVEHAVQMVADEQTHTLPEDDEGLERIAHMLGFADADAFSLAFRASLQQVERHYAALFETAPELSTGIGNLVFTGDVDDPDTLQTLHGLGFQRPSDICRVIRGWHFGRYRVTQSAEARERLTELTPALLRSFGQTRRADEALIRFDEFLAGLPAGIQLFSLLQSNPALLKLLATIMGAAPRLAAIITRRPHVFDGLLDPALLTELPDRAYLSGRLSAFLEGDRAHEDVLDRLRIFASEQKFLIGVRLLAGSIDPARAGHAFSDLADLTIEAALGAVTTEFSARHGKIAGGMVSLLGMGKLGSRELTAGSDVDLILLYDHEADADESDGDKPLAPSHYYTRITQRLISAVSAPTAEGVLYELDLRLRPSGNKGPVATHIDAFKKYQREEAWTWEHMALSRARAIAGDASLCGEVEAEVASVLGQPRDAAKVRSEAAEMRAMIEVEKPPRDLWDIKLVPGGLIDLEFIAQVAVITGQVEAGPRITGTAEILSRLAPRFANTGVRQELVDAYSLYLALTQMTRLCLTGAFERDDVPPGLSDLLLAVTDLPDFGVLEAHLKETSRKVRKDFDLLLRAGRR